MRLNEQLDNLTTILTSALDELSGLREQITRLESENERLREELHAAHMTPQESGSTTENSVEINNTLLQLFEEGYHICHVSFGQMRDGECIFCQALLPHD